MNLRVGWCNRCAAEILDVDAPGSCECDQGRLLRHLAHQRAQTKMARNAPPVPIPRKGSLDHLASIPVVNPFAPRTARSPATPRPALNLPRVQSPQSMADFVNHMFMAGSDPRLVSDNVLEGMWSTDPGGDIDVAAGGPVPDDNGLSALWADQVAQDTGEVIGSQGDLDSIWMREISSPSGSTVANTLDEIEFEVDFETDIDAELAQAPSQRTASRMYRAPSRPEPQQRRPPNRDVLSRNEAVTRAQERMAREPDSRPMPTAGSRPIARPRPSESVMTRTAQVANRPTSYDQLMSDD